MLSKPFPAMLDLVNKIMHYTVYTVTSKKPKSKTPLTPCIQ